MRFTPYKMSFLIFAIIAISLCNGYIIEENNKGDLFQGDMKLTALQRIIVENGGDISLAGMTRSRGTLVPWGPFWHPAYPIPYKIHADLDKIPEATFSIMKALREWESYTCLKFTERTNETAYIHFITNCTGCWSFVGRQGNAQSLCLDNGCFYPGTVVHELAHAVGICHEQSRPDRDQFIKIFKENVKDGYEDQFIKYGNSVIDSMGFEYDYMSIMQYSDRAFSKNGNYTMLPTRKGVLQLGQRLTFSEGDILQFNKLYKCNGKTMRSPVKDEVYSLTGKYDCTFDQGNCHFVQDKKDTYDWRGRIGPSVDSSGGPKYDHTTKRLGRYMTVDSLPPGKKGDIARLVSASMPPTRATCFTFFYHMYAPEVTQLGTFNIYILRNNSNEKPVRVFTRTGSQRNEWIQESITLAVNSSYKIILEGIRGTDLQGDIAIDDISFTNGRCLPSRHKCDAHARTEGECTDVKDREQKYCKSWENGGLCETEMEDMMHLCRKTCMFCT